jgi:SAM-dependent methyltransferase
MSINQWDERYAADEYVYGTEPNDFLRAEYHRIPTGGTVLCLADGEGRNGVFLAMQGYKVTSVDLSSVGLAKARTLAKAAGVELSTVHADLAEYDLGERAWEGIVSVFCHVPQELRERLHGNVARALRSGGMFILEAYTPDQPGNNSGGPPAAMSDRLMTAAQLQHELSGCNVISCRELTREIHEGTLHNGHSSVVQCLATTPGHSS